MSKREEIEAAVASALYKQAVKEAQQLARSFDFQTERVGRVFKTAANESDRSAAILMFALAEDLMAAGLRANMKDCVAWERAHGPNGALSTASNRLDLLELLSWIRTATAADLRLMKSIRNRFAHHAEVNSFEDQKVAGWLSSMSASERPAIAAMLEVDPTCKDWQPNARSAFLMRSAYTILSLLEDLAILPAAKSLRVSAADVARADWEELEDGRKELRRLVAEVIVTCAELSNW